MRALVFTLTTSPKPFGRRATGKSLGIVSRKGLPPLNGQSYPFLSVLVRSSDILSCIIVPTCACNWDWNWRIRKASAISPRLAARWPQVGSEMLGLCINRGKITGEPRTSTLSMPAHLKSLLDDPPRERRRRMTPQNSSEAPHSGAS